MAASKSSGGIIWSGDKLSDSVTKFSALMSAKIGALFEYEANEAQNYMRTNAPWTDRTANARQGLFARSFIGPGNFVIVLYHTMPYGIWLETRWSGKYRIIEPAVQYSGKHVMNSLNKLMAAL